MGSCNNGKITGQSIGVNDGCYYSQLNATFTADLNDRFVQCIHDSSNENEELNTIGTIFLTVISGENN